MALHRKRENFARAAARLPLEANGPVELPAAEINEEAVSVERQEFAAYLPELFAALRQGGTVQPVPVVQSNALLAVNGATRAFWVRLWHTDETRAGIARLHVLNCLPLTPRVKINLGG